MLPSQPSTTQTTQTRTLSPETSIRFDLSPSYTPTTLPTTPILPLQLNPNFDASNLSHSDVAVPQIHLALLIKDLTRSCKHLLLSLLDLENASEDSVWEGYALVCKRYREVRAKLRDVASQTSTSSDATTTAEPESHTTDEEEDVESFPMGLKQVLEEVLLEVRDSPDASRATSPGLSFATSADSRPTSRASSRLVSGDKLHTLITGMLKDVRSRYDAYVHTSEPGSASSVNRTWSAMDMRTPSIASTVDHTLSPPTPLRPPIPAEHQIPGWNAEDLKRDSKYASGGSAVDPMRKGSVSSEVQEYPRKSSVSSLLPAYPTMHRPKRESVHSQSSGGSRLQSPPPEQRPPEVLTLHLHLSTSSRSHTFQTPLTLPQLQATFHAILASNPSLTTPNPEDLAIWKRVEEQKLWVRVKESNVAEVKDGEVLRCSPRYGESPRGERRVLRQSHSVAAGRAERKDRESAVPVPVPQIPARAPSTERGSRIPMPKSPSADTIPQLPASQLPRRTSATSPPGSRPGSALGQPRHPPAVTEMQTPSINTNVHAHHVAVASPSAFEPPASAPVRDYKPTLPNQRYTHCASHDQSSRRTSNLADLPQRRPSMPNAESAPARRPSVASISSTKSSVPSSYRRQPPLPRPNQPLPTLPKDQVPIKLRRDREREEEIARLKTELAKVNEELKLVHASQAAQRRMKGEQEQLQVELESVKERHQREIERLEVLLAQAQAQVATLQSEVLKKDEAVHAMEQQQQTMQSTLSNKADMLSQHKAQLESHKSEVTVLRQECLKKDEQISRLSQRIVGQMDKLKQKDEEVMRERKHVEDRQTQVELHRKQVQRMALRMTKQKEGMEMQALELAKAKEAMMAMESQVRKLQLAFKQGVETVRREMGDKLRTYESTALGISAVGDASWTPTSKNRSLKASTSSASTAATMTTAMTSTSLLESMKGPIESRKEEVKQRLETLSNSLASTRSEITQYGSVPDDEQLQYLSREADSIQIHLDACSSLLDKKALKAAWEVSIASVVGEQGYVSQLQEELEDIDEALEDVKDMLKKIMRIAEICKERPKAQAGLLRRASVSRAENRSNGKESPYSPPPQEAPVPRGVRTRSKTGSGKKRVRLVLDPINGTMTRRHTVSPRAYMPPDRPPEITDEEMPKLVLEELKMHDHTPSDQRLEQISKAEIKRMEKIEQHKKEGVPLQKELNMFFEAESAPATPLSEYDSGRDTPTGFKNKIGLGHIEQVREERNKEILMKLYAAKKLQESMGPEFDESMDESKEKSSASESTVKAPVSRSHSSESSNSQTTEIAAPVPQQQQRPFHRHQPSNCSTATTSPATSETMVPSPTSTGEMPNNPAFDIKLQHFANHDALDRHQGASVPLPQASAATPHIDFARKHHQRTHAFSYPSARHAQPEERTRPVSESTPGVDVKPEPGAVQGIVQMMNSPPTVARDTTTVLVRRRSADSQSHTTTRRSRPKRPESIASEYGKPRYRVMVPTPIR